MNRLLPRAMDLTTSTSLSATGRLTCAAFPTAWLGPTIGSIITASRIIRSICTSRRRRSGCTIPTRVNGASTCSIWTKAVLSVPPVVGEFSGNRGEFYDQEQYKGRAILVRYLWLNISPKSARMEQAFSADGGKTWETNWICELSR